METALKLFEDKKIRTHWDESQEKWYFSIVDVIAALTENDYQHARNYWKVLKTRLKAEGNQSVTNCNQLKMQSSDGKFYNTDVADTEQILRLIQSVPSKKAEPFKVWLAELSATEISKKENPKGFCETMRVASRGGGVARAARLQLEKETGKKMITGRNAKLLKKVG